MTVSNSKCNKQEKTFAPEKMGVVRIATSEATACRSAVSQCMLNAQRFMVLGDYTMVSKNRQDFDLYMTKFWNELDKICAKREMDE